MDNNYIRFNQIDQDQADLEACGTKRTKRNSLFGILLFIVGLLGLCLYLSQDNSTNLE